MRQVPQENTEIPFLIIGRGQLARHFCHYFALLSIPYRQWWRGSGHPLPPFLDRAAKILVLINDDAIEEFIRENRFPNPNQVWIHCSGLLTTGLAESAHPLMTFADTLYDLSIYQQVLFVTESGRGSFPELFPELPNPHTAIPSHLKGFYHAWCSLAGNFTTLLWREFFQRLEQKTGIDRHLIYPYLNQVAHNIQQTNLALTGPLSRRDKKTIQTHLESLKNDDFLDAYQVFVEIYQAARNHAVSG